MELEKYKERSHLLTSKASEIARQLNFAGIGIIWIIKSSFPTIKLSDSELLLPLILISISLIFDFLHYAIGGLIWITFYNNKIKSGSSSDADIKSAPWRKNLLYFFYYGKLILVFLAYIFIAQTLFFYF